MLMNWRVWIVALLLVLAGCNRRPQTVAVKPVDPAPPPPPPPTVTLANEELAQGEYRLAARDFENYLGLVASGNDRDEALFGLGLLYALRENPDRDWQKAETFIAQLASEFPLSPLTPAARLLLSLQRESTQLSAEVSQLRVEADLREAEANQLRQSSTGLAEEIERLKQDSERLTAEVERREQRIRQLNTELERLIRIDSERRPRP